MHTKFALSLSDARAILEAAATNAIESGSACSIAVVDDAGVPLVLLRLDGARLHTPDAAVLKARTAAITCSDTEELQHQVATNAALLAFPGRLPLTGGMPIRYRDQVVGAIGVSGGTPEQDLLACRAGLAGLPPG